MSVPVLDNTAPRAILPTPPLPPAPPAELSREALRAIVLAMIG